MSRETKTLHFKIKATEITKDANGSEFGQIEAYGAVFDTVDEGNDRIVSGAFKRTISNSKARAKAREKKYVLPMLWQHDPGELIGGWYDLKEDHYGLLCKGEIALATQRGREYYELAKAGMADLFSIIYDIPQDGAKYDKSGVRELSELRLFSVDPVTFAMNEDTMLVGVKSLENLDNKAVTGNTSGPIGPRDESWDGAKAKRQIWVAAEKEDGSLNASLAKKYFMVCDGDAQTKGSYGYPFWYVGSSPHICVGAVKAIAAAVQGARGANAPDGLKAKVQTLYGRINRKYPDDTELVPPWKDDGKGSHMNRQKKTFEEHYQEEMCEDLLEDFQDVLVCALCCAIMDAFKIGDQPEADIREALAAFNEAAIAWTAQAIEYNLSEFLDSASGDWSPYDYTIRNGSRGYMSRARSLSRKAGRAISAANAGKIQDHMDALHGIADDHMKAVKAHVKAIHAAADGMADMMPADGDGKEPNNEDDQQDGKKAASSSKTRRSDARSPASTVTEEEVTSTLGTLQSLFQA